MRMWMWAAAVLVFWGGLMAAVVLANAPGAPAGLAHTPGAAGASPWPWAVLERRGTGWVEVGGPFPDAGACLSVSDRLNNADAGRVYDCDPVRSSAAHTTHTTLPFHRVS
jgi:hypothetical protein